MQTARLEGGVERMKIAAGIRVRYTVPVDARESAVPDGRNYIHICRPVCGGVINYHLYTNEDLRGQRITVSVEVWRKRLSDGRVFVYLDMYPTSAPTNYKLKVYARVSDIPGKYQALRTFGNIGDIKGCLVFVPHPT